MNAVIEHGTPLVDDRKRIGAVTQLGVDETSFLRANRSHATLYATALVDPEAKVLIDMVEGNTAADCGGPRTPMQTGSPASRWWPPTWPSPSGLGCRPTSTTQPGSPIPFTS